MPRKGVIEMPETIFILTRDDVVQCLKELDLPGVDAPDKIVTEDFLREVKKGVEFGLECWSEVMKEAILMALKS